MKKFVLRLLLCLLAFPVMSSAARTAYIRIGTQAEFDRLGTTLEETLRAGADRVVVQLPPGTFYYRDKHLDLDGKRWPSVSLLLQGSGTVLMPAGADYSKGDAFQGSFSPSLAFFTPDGKDVPVWSRIREIGSTVEVLNVQKKSCRLRVGGLRDRSAAECRDAYILIPQWFSSAIYHVESIKGGYLYFTVPDLRISYNGGYQVNNDMNYAKMPLRLKCCNIPTGEDLLSLPGGKVSLPKGVDRVHACSAQTFATFSSGCMLKGVSLSGLHFRGNRDDGGYLIAFIGAQIGQAEISDCTFEGIRSDVIGFRDCAHALIRNNTFYGCYLYGIYSSNSTRDIRIIGNRFDRMGLGMMNTFSAVCRGRDYRIADNLFTDFGYGAIGIGVNFNQQNPIESSGIVENNEMRFSPEYMADIAQYGIMDSGAIYLWTRNEGTIVRNNRIHGYSGRHENRGIFCDDGARGFTLENNFITGVANSFTIDSRRVDSVEDRCGIANVDVVIRGNIVDGPIRFEGNETHGRCYYGGNQLLGEDIRLYLSNVERTAPDVVWKSARTENGSLVVSEPKEFRTARRFLRGLGWRKLLRRK